MGKRKIDLRDNSEDRQPKRRRRSEEYEREIKILRRQLAKGHRRHHHGGRHDYYDHDRSSRGNRELSRPLTPIVKRE